MNNREKKEKEWEEIITNMIQEVIQISCLPLGFLSYSNQFLWSEMPSVPDPNCQSQSLAPSWPLITHMTVPSTLPQISFQSWLPASAFGPRCSQLLSHHSNQFFLSPTECILSYIVSSHPCLPSCPLQWLIPKWPSIIFQLLLNVLNLEFCLHTNNHKMASLRIKVTHLHWAALRNWPHILSWKKALIRGNTAITISN